jgi:hypothetical protein
MYFDRVNDKVDLPIAWHEASDRDYVIAGRRGKDYYRLADLWLRNEVAAQRTRAADPIQAALLDDVARSARDQMRLLQHPAPAP